MKKQVLTFYSFQKSIPISSGFYLITDFVDKSFYWSYFNEITKGWTTAHLKFDDTLSMVQKKPMNDVCVLKNESFGKIWYWATAPKEWYPSNVGGFVSHLNVQSGAYTGIYTWDDVSLVEKRGAGSGFYTFCSGEVDLADTDDLKQYIFPLFDKEHKVFQTGGWSALYEEVGWEGLFKNMAMSLGYKAYGNSMGYTPGSMSFGLGAYDKPYLAWTMKDGKITKHEKPKEEPKKELSDAELEKAFNEAMNPNPSPWAAWEAKKAASTQPPGKTLDDILAEMKQKSDAVAAKQKQMQEFVAMKAQEAKLSQQEIINNFLYGTAAGPSPKIEGTPIKKKKPIPAVKVIKPHTTPAAAPTANTTGIHHNWPSFTIDDFKVFEDL